MYKSGLESKLTACINQRQNFNKGNLQCTIKMSLVTMFFSITPFMVEVHVTACDKFVYSGHREQSSLLHHPCDGSMFNIIKGDMMPSVLLQDGKQMKIAGCQIQTVWGMTQCFSTTYLQQVSGSDVLCAVGHCQGGESHHHYGEQDIFFHPLSGSLCSTAVAVLPLHICLKLHDQEY